jgi:hypothetical protein
MTRRFVCTVLVGMGVLLSSVLCFTKAEPPVPASDDSMQGYSETVEQLKEINAQLKELNAMFRSGRARVIVLVNTDVEETK